MGYRGKVLLHPVGHTDPRKFLSVLLVGAALYDKDLALAMIHIVFHLRSRKPEHDGDDDEASLCRGGIDIQPLHTVIGQDGKAIALLHPHIGKRIGESACTFIPFLKGELAIQVLRADFVGPFGGIYP